MQAESFVNPQTAATALTAHAEAVSAWAGEHQLLVSAPRSHEQLLLNKLNLDHKSLSINRLCTWW